MKLFKKIAAFVLVAVMVLSLVACGNNGNNSEETQKEDKVISIQLIVGDPDSGEVLSDEYIGAADDVKTCWDALYQLYLVESVIKFEFNEEENLLVSINDMKQDAKDDKGNISTWNVYLNGKPAKMSDSVKAGDSVVFAYETKKDVKEVESTVKFNLYVGDPENADNPYAEIEGVVVGNQDEVTIMQALYQIVDNAKKEAESAAAESDTSYEPPFKTQIEFDSDKKTIKKIDTYAVTEPGADNKYKGWAILTLNGKETDEKATIKDGDTIVLAYIDCQTEQ